MPAIEARSVWFPSPGEVDIRSEMLPPISPHDVHITAISSALSHGTEMLVYRGQVPAGLELDLPTLAGSFQFPVKYGYASVGRVIDVGDRVENLRPGDLVFTHHPHQTEYVVPANVPVRLRPACMPEDAVFLANLETAINIVLDAAPRLGERVVVFGQGVVGLLVSQLLRRVGVGLLIAVDPFARRRELAVVSGADLALAPGAAVADAARQQTSGAGVDLAIEVSGNPAALADAMSCLAIQGTVVVASWYGTKQAPLPLGSAFHRRRLRLVSSQVGSLDPHLTPRWDRDRRMALAIDLLDKLRLRDLITHRVPFARAADAYRLVDREPEETGQVILTYEKADV
ncbi:MAG: zinc-binding dehydrogenase [Chloroflexota bacterium]